MYSSGQIDDLKMTKQGLFYGESCRGSQDLTPQNNLQLLSSFYIDKPKRLSVCVCILLFILFSSLFGGLGHQASSMTGNWVRAKQD